MFYFSIWGLRFLTKKHKTNVGLLTEEIFYLQNF